MNVGLSNGRFPEGIVIDYYARSFHPIAGGGGDIMAGGFDSSFWREGSYHYHAGQARVARPPPSAPTTTTTTTMIPAPISRTALDSLHAKLSSIDNGWLDGCSGRTRTTSNENDENDDNDDDDSAIVGPVRSYCKLLRRIGRGAEAEDGRSRRRKRRQTPLVNAFYGARIAAMTHALERWTCGATSTIAASSATGTPSVSTAPPSSGCDDACDDDVAIGRGGCAAINVIVLGCGMDAIGIWSRHCLSSSSSSSRMTDGSMPKVKVYEFDALDNCKMRRRALVKSGLIDESLSSSSCDEMLDDDDDGVVVDDDDDDVACHDGRMGASCRKRDDDHECHDPTTSPARIVSRGRMMIDDDLTCACHRSDDGDDGHEDDDYFLISLDLRCAASSSSTTSPSVDDGEGDDTIGSNRESGLSRALRDVGFDHSRPTIVISELVLAYLGYDGANDIMRTIADDVLGGNEHSMFVCLEPVFPLVDAKKCDRDGDGDGVRATNMICVEESYSIDYGRQFLSKLRDGNSRHHRAKKEKGANDNELIDPSSLWLHPLGTNMTDVRLRLEACGFPSSGICHATLGRAVGNVARVRRAMPGGAPNFLRAKEPFDEHAALALCLDCYAIACVFPSSYYPSLDKKSNETKEDNGGAVRRREDICPWWILSDDRVVGSFRIRPIASKFEDGLVRDLYGKLYANLYDEYPAIRRMVKSAMRTDLGVDASHDATDDRSAIRDRFRRKGGDFWIATDAVDERRLVGCIGIGPREGRITSKIEPISSSASVIGYEIQRLAVDERYRGKGLGTSLLSVAEEWARGDRLRSMPKTTVPVSLRAVTPACLIAANKLYESVSYAKEETFWAGSILMNVYCKRIEIIIQG